MRITFVLPFVHPGGGVRVVFEHATELQKRGHQVLIIYPGPEGVHKKYREPERTLRSLKYALDHAQGKHEHGWFGQPLSVRRIPDLRPTHIPNADLVIATSNETADWVVSYPPRCGQGVYFIQDYESWSRSPEKVDQTWRYPLERIAISEWLCTLGQERFAVPVHGPVPNGINTELFFPDPPLPASKRPFDILMIYRQSPQKGCKRGLEILRHLKEKHPEAKLQFFGRDQAPESLLALGSYHHDPSQEKIRQLYSSSRIFFLPSFQEGFSLTPMEATACGAAVVSTAVGGPMDFLEDQESGLLVDPKNDQALSRALEQAFTQPVLCNQWAKAAHTRLQNYTWERSTDMLEKILQDIHRNARS